MIYLIGTSYSTFDAMRGSSSKIDLLDHNRIMRINLQKSIIFEKICIAYFFSYMSTSSRKSWFEDKDSIRSKNVNKYEVERRGS